MEVVTGLQTEASQHSSTSSSPFFPSLFRRGSGGSK
jgi:hypothetical protein